jgi:hypothetical protein
MRAAVDARKVADQAKRSPCEELRAYLAVPLESAENIVTWWGVSCLYLIFSIDVQLMDCQQHSLQYPILACIARDYLAIQGSATPSERAFSSGALMDTKRCSRLTLPVFEALQILKSAYRNGHIKAGDQAEEYYQGFMAALDILEEAEDGEEF